MKAWSIAQLAAAWWLLVLAAPAWALFPATGGFTIDTSDRLATRAHFLSLFGASENTPMGWNGDVATCHAGTTGEDYKDAVMLRVNLFRALAGVPAVIDHLPAYDAKAQQAALIMSANGQLSHTPPSTWTCWNVDGDEAAGKSNLSLGNQGWNAVYSQMRDNGANNDIVGHRRWILYPQTHQMGTGDIPANGGFRETNSLWVIDDRFGSARPVTRDDFVAWPPPGFVPWRVVYPRWSFSYPGADFSLATVTMTHDGVAVPVTLEPWRDVNVGESTLVWKPVDGSVLGTDGAGRPAADTAYSVTIDNVSVAGQARSFSYQVTVIDPDAVGIGEALPTLSGPATVTVGRAANFDYVVANGLRGYRMRILQSQVYGEIEGGENGATNLVDGTDADYPLIATGNAASGLHAMHLAHPNGHDQYFALAPEFVLGPTARLRFVSRLGWAAEVQTARVLISLDDGLSWIELYALSGTNGITENAYAAHDIDLGAWAGQVARFRFEYRLDNGSYYPQTDAEVGWSVDQIELLDSERVTQSNIVELDESGHFPFLANAAGDYRLQVGTSAVEGFAPSIWGAARRVVAEASPAVPSGFDVDGSGGPPDALSDGIIVIRYLFGFRGTALTENAAASGGAAPDLVERHLATLEASLDIDGDGRRDALSDGILLIRYLFGFRGDALVSGALSPGATRVTAAAVEGWIVGLGL